MRVFAACLRAVLNFFSEILFGCSHSRLTRPFTLEDRTYKVCLDCGRQVDYSAREMRPLTGGEIRRIRAAQAGEVKVMPMTAGRPQLVPAHESKPNAAA